VSLKPPDNANQPATATYDVFVNSTTGAQRDALAALTNADAFEFGLTSVAQTRNTTRNVDGGFFGVDVVTAGTTKAHVALQSVARNQVAGASAWGFNALVVSNQTHQTGYGIWGGEFDVNYSGTSSGTVFSSAQNVKGVTAASGGTGRPLLAFGVDKGAGKAPFVYGLRFAYEGGEAAVWDSGVSVMDQAASATHVSYAAHVQAETVPRFQFTAAGVLSWGSGSGAVDTTLSREGAGALNSGTTTIAAWHFYATNSIEVRGTGGNGYLQLEQQSSAPAGSASKSRLFSRDNGSGKQQFCVQFPTGAVQVVATQP
jgi:hypothetical protein